MNKSLFVEEHFWSNRLLRYISSVKMRVSRGVPIHTVKVSVRLKGMFAEDYFPSIHFWRGKTPSVICRGKASLMYSDNSNKVTLLKQHYSKGEGNNLS